MSLLLGLLPALPAQQAYFATLTYPMIILTISDTCVRGSSLIFRILERKR